MLAQVTADALRPHDTAGPPGGFEKGDVDAVACLSKGMGKGQAADAGADNDDARQVWDWMCSLDGSGEHGLFGPPFAQVPIEHHCVVGYEQAS